MKLLIRFFVLTSVNNLPVAKTFVKDELFRAHMTLLMEERVENAVERVQKLPAITVALVGHTERGLSSAGNRGAVGRRKCMKGKEFARLQHPLSALHSGEGPAKLRKGVEL